MANEPAQKNIFASIAKVLGIVAIIFALLPLVAGFLSFLIIINWIIAPVAIICAIIALIKDNKNKKAIIGGVLAIVALALPIVLSDTYSKKTGEAVGGIMNAARNAGSDSDSNDFGFGW